MSRSRAILTAVLAASGAWAITPEAMLAANRYSDAVPNPAGVSDILYHFAVPHDL